MAASVRFTAAVHAEDDGTYWAQVNELPGCFASGHDLDELEEALVDAIKLCLPDGISISDATVERIDDAELLVCA